MKLFLVCVIMCALNLAADIYLLAHGIKSVPGVVMAGFWLLLAWIHARRAGKA